MNYATRPSPNFGPRRGGRGIDMVVLHYTGMESAEAAVEWLANPASEVSCHYLVFEDGRVVQLVAEADRAWHAGQSSWEGEPDVNSRSIGVEVANPGHRYGYPEFPMVQIDAVIALCKDIVDRLHIRPERVLAHSDVAPARKIDPGEKFPWARLAAEGVGLWPDEEAETSRGSLATGTRGRHVADLRKRFRAFGYAVEDGEEFDPGLETVVGAFQRHFRPRRVDGVADGETVGRLARLLTLTGRTA